MRVPDAVQAVAGQTVLQPHQLRRHASVRRRTAENLGQLLVGQVGQGGGHQGGGPLERSALLVVGRELCREQQPGVGQVEGGETGAQARRGEAQHQAEMPLPVKRHRCGQHRKAQLPVVPGHQVGDQFDQRRPAGNDRQPVAEDPGTVPEHVDRPQRVEDELQRFAGHRHPVHDGRQVEPGGKVYPLTRSHPQPVEDPGLAEVHLLGGQAQRGHPGRGPGALGRRGRAARDLGAAPPLWHPPGVDRGGSRQQLS